MKRWMVRAVCLGAMGLLGTLEQLPSADPPAAARTQNPASEWKTLTARKKEIVSELEALQKQFAAASPDDKAKLREQALALLNEFEKQLYPRLTELAPIVYQQDPGNVEAAEAVLEATFHKNQFEKSAAIGDRLLAAGHKTPLIVNVAGVSHFAIHNFEKARDILRQAEANGQLHPQLGARYLHDAEQYIELWKTEQAIREKEANAPPAEQLPRVQFTTNRGKIILELFENEAPNTVANFVSLVEAGKYDKIRFHRVLPQFMAQGGDPNTLDDDPSNDGTGGPGYAIPCECYQENARMHFRGSLSMAHAGKDTGGSQFFLTHLPTSHLNPNPERQSGHTVFGRVVEGLDVVAALEKDDQILAAKVLRKRDHEYKPTTIASRR